MDIIAVDNLSGRQFEGFLAKLLADIGFANVQRTALSGDFGGDILAEKDGKTCVIQAKRVGRTVGVRAVQEAHAAKEYYRVNTSMVVANRAFSIRAKELAHRCGCVLVDRATLEHWLGGKFASSADLFRYMSEKAVTRHRISNDDLVLAYRVLRSELGRHVRARDMDTLGKHSSSAYRKRWGSWNRFLLEVGAPPILRRDLTDDNLVAEYKRIQASMEKLQLGLNLLVCLHMHLAGTRESGVLGINFSIVLVRRRPRDISYRRRSWLPSSNVFALY